MMGVRAAATTGVATMIDPLLSPPARRSAPVAPQTQKTKRKRAKPARVSKIITAGASATALFTMVAAMGWQTGVGAADVSVPSDPPAEPTPVQVVVPIAPTTTATTTPPSVTPTVATAPPVVVPVVAVPVATVPPVTAAPVVVPKAVPVTVPVKKVTKHKSNTTTKTSG